jgi:hypothetical protein
LHQKWQTKQSELFFFALHCCCSNQHSRLILGEGGYFDSQTTDTQFFVPLDQSLLVHCSTTDGPAVDGAGKSSTVTNVELSPAVSPPETLGTSGQTSPDSPNQQSHGLKEKWDQLDDLLNGPDYSNGQLWMMFPVLKCHRPDVDHPAQALKWLYNTL